MPRAKYDWPTIRQEFVAGGDEVTLGDLAEKYGCHYQTIRNRSYKEKWLEQKRRFQSKVRTQTENLAATHQAKRRASMLTVADSMKRVAGISIKRLLKELENDTGKRLSVNELRQMFKDATDIERVALGIPDGQAMTDEELDATIVDLIAELDSGGEASGSEGPDQD
jgi:hypothetical protein